MFGFRGGENDETVTRKRGYMKDAQQRWPFMTNFDASTIKSQGQLVALVRDRSGAPRADVEVDVQAWVEGKTF